MPLGGVGASREIMMIIRARNEAGRVFTAIGSDIDFMSRRASQAAAQTIGLGAALTAVGAGFAAVGVAGLAFYKSAIEGAIEYDRQSRLTVTQIHRQDEAFIQSGEKLKRVKDIGIEVARAVPVPFKEMQGALFDIFSTTDLKMEDAKRSLHLFAQAAAAGQVPLRDMTRIGIDLMNNFSMGAEKLPNILGAIFKAVQLGKGDYSEFAANVGRSASAARNFGQSLPTFLATTAALSRMLPSMGNTTASVGRMFDAFVKATPKIEGMGVAMQNAETGAFRPFRDIIHDLALKLKDLGEVDLAAKINDIFKGVGGTTQAMRGIRTLIFQEIEAIKAGVPSMLSDMIDAMEAAFVNGGSELQKAIKLMMESPAAQMQLFANLWEVLKVKVGEAVMPMAAAILGFANKVLQAFLDLDQGTQDFISKIGLIGSASAVVVGGITAIVGVFMVLKGALAFAGVSMATFIGTIGGLTLAVGALATIGYTIVRNWETLSNFWEDHKALVLALAGSITAVLLPSLLTLASATLVVSLSSVAKALSAVAAAGGFEVLAHTLGRISYLLLEGRLMDTLTYFGQTVLGRIRDGFTNATSSLSGFLSAAGRIGGALAIGALLLWIDKTREASEKAQNLADSWLKMAKESEAPSKAITSRITEIVGKLDEEGQAWFRLTGKVEDNRTLFEQYILRKKAAVTEAEIRFVEAAQREMTHADELSKKTGLSTDAIIALSTSIGVDLSQKGKKGFGEVIEAAEQLKFSVSAIGGMTEKELKPFAELMAKYPQQFRDYSAAVGGGTAALEIFSTTAKNAGSDTKEVKKALEELGKDAQKFVQPVIDAFSGFQSIISNFNTKASEESKERIASIDAEINTLKKQLSEGTKEAVGSMTEVIDANKNSIAELKRRNVELNIEAKDASEERYEQIQREIDRNKVRMAQLQEESTQYRTNTNEIKAAGKEQIEARIAQLEELKKKEEGSTKGSADTIRRFFKETSDEANTFLSNIRLVMEKNLDPEFVAQLMMAGPEKAAPLLNALVQGNIDENIRMVNSGVEAAQKITTQALEVQHILYKAVHSEAAKFREEAPDAIRISMEKFKQGVDATIESVAAALKIPVDRVDQISADFGLGLQRSLDKQDIKVPIGSNMDPAWKALNEWGREIWEDHKWYGGFAAINIGSNTQPAESQIQTVYDTVHSNSAYVPLGADPKVAYEQIIAIWDGVSSNSVYIPVGIDAGDFYKGMEQIGRDFQNAIAGMKHDSGNIMAQAGQPSGGGGGGSTGWGPAWYGGIYGAQLGGVFHGRLGRGILRRIGEQGAEMVLPLTRPERLIELLSLPQMQKYLLRAIQRTGGPLGAAGEQLPGQLGGGVGRGMGQLNFDAILAPAGEATVKGFVKGVDIKMGEVTGVMTTLGDKVKGWDQPELMGNGQTIIDGLNQGFHDRFPVVQSVLGNLTNNIVAWKGPNDYELLTPAGKEIIDGLIRGLMAQYPELQGTLSQFTDVLRDYFATVLQEGDYLNDWLTHLPPAVSDSTLAFRHMAEAMIQASEAAMRLRNSYEATRAAQWEMQSAARQAQSSAPSEDSPGWDWRTQGNRQRGVQDRRGHWYIEHADGGYSQHPNDPNAPWPPEFHRGGIVGGGSAGQKEVLALLEEGEGVITGRGLMKLAHRQARHNASVHEGNIIIEEGAVQITVQGSIDEKVLPAVEAALQRSLKEVLRSHKAGRTRR